MQYIVFRPADKLWIGYCRDFVHAFQTWKRLPDNDNWFIGRLNEQQERISGRGWFKFGEPRAMRPSKPGRTPDRRKRR